MKRFVATLFIAITACGAHVRLIRMSREEASDRLNDIISKRGWDYSNLSLQVSPQPLTADQVSSATGYFRPPFIVAIFHDEPVWLFTFVPQHAPGELVLDGDLFYLVGAYSGTVACNLDICLRNGGILPESTSHNPP